MKHEIVPTTIVSCRKDSGSGCKAVADLFVNDVTNPAYGKIVRVWVAVTFKHTDDVDKGLTYDVRLSEKGPVGQWGWRDALTSYLVPYPEGRDRAAARELRTKIARAVACETVRTACLTKSSQCENIRQVVRGHLEAEGIV